MSLLSAAEASDVSEVILGSGVDVHSFITFGVVGLGLARLRLMLTLILVYETCDDVVERVIAIGSSVERDKKRVVQMGKSGCDAKNDVIFGYDNFCLFE